MKKKLCLLVALALLLSAFAFQGAAAPVATAHEHTVHDSCCPPDASITRAEICRNCGEQSLVYNCGGEHVSTGTGTHLLGTCTVTYTKSRTIEYCNAGCGAVASYWHSYCDEYHTGCGKGWYATCTIEYY